MELIAASAPLRDVNRLRRAAQLQDPGLRALIATSPSDEDGSEDSNTLAAEVETLRSTGLAVEAETLRRELAQVHASRSWRLTSPIRSFTTWLRTRFPTFLRFVRRLRGLG